MIDEQLKHIIMEIWRDGYHNGSDWGEKIFIDPDDLEYFVARIKELFE